MLAVDLDIQLSAQLSLELHIGIRTKDWLDTTS